MFSFFSPQSINSFASYFHNLISEEEFGKEAYAIKRNLGYNCQFIEYLIHSLNTASLHTVIHTQMQKTLIITTASVIETIIYSVLRNNKLNRKREWKEVEKFKSNKKKVNDVFYKSETLVFKEIEPVENYMTFDWMIKKCRSKQLLGSDQIIYQRLKEIKSLRNKVHLFTLKNQYDTDWNAFNPKQCEMIIETFNSILDYVIKDSNGLNNQFDFLKKMMSDQ